jgi:8-oxo-dGTP pyrophosphatase MutT (NUDIX family)
MRSLIDDSRMVIPQCHALQPVSVEYKNEWFCVKKRGSYYTIETEYPQVCILPIVDNHSIVLVCVKRPVIIDNPLEIPGGSMKRSETPVDAAARELREETGIDIQNLLRFQMIFPLSHSSTRKPTFEYIYQLHVSQEEFNDREPFDEEIVSVECIPFDIVKDKIIGGEIYVGLSVAILSRFLLAV